jgi:hypothetical protein
VSPSAVAPLAESLATTATDFSNGIGEGIAAQAIAVHNRTTAANAILFGNEREPFRFDESIQASYGSCCSTVRSGDGRGDRRHGLSTATILVVLVAVGTQLRRTTGWSQSTRCRSCGTFSLERLERIRLLELIHALRTLVRPMAAARTAFTTASRLLKASRMLAQGSALEDRQGFRISPRRSASNCSLQFAISLRSSFSTK